MTMTGDQLRAQANAADQRAADSFERCDTDGFMSQWASGLSARKLRMEADIADNGGVWGFERLRLVTLDGQATDARRVETRYGLKWRLDSTDQWLPYAPKREATLAGRGYREVVEREMAPAKVTYSDAKCLTNVGIRVYRPDARKSDGWYTIGATID